MQGILKKENSFCLRKILIGVYIIYLAVYCALDVVLGLAEMEYRTWFQVLSLMYLWLFPVVGIGYLLFEWLQRTAKGISGLVLSVYGIVMILVSFFLFVLMIFMVDAEKRLDSGILRVEKGDALYGGAYEYYVPKAFIFRKKLDWQFETDESGAEQENGWSGNEEAGPDRAETEEPVTSAEREADISDRTEAETSGRTEADEIERIRHPDRKQTFMDEYEAKKENAHYLNVYEGDYPLADAVWLIYEEYYLDSPDSEREAPCFAYNAKGNFYAEVAGQNDSRVLLVYNGVSENGKCQLFVAEEEHYDEAGSQLDNTSLLEFYAVNLEEGQVYAAHKTTWGGAESEEYRNATSQ